MKKEVTLPVVAIVVIVLLALVMITRAPASGTPPVSATPAVATSTITASTTNYTVEAAYPQFGIPAIDEKIKGVVENAAQSLESQATADQPAKNGYPIYDFTSSFDSAYIGPDLVSVRLALAQYTGGAHEQPVIVGATFHRDTGALVALDEALALTGMDLQQLASSSKAQLAKDPNTQPTDIWASGSDPSPENYSTFLIDKDSVTFIFQPYQVAPFAAGAPEVTFPRVK